jgi:Ca-activated chloride channel family protein
MARPADRHTGVRSHRKGGRRRAPVLGWVAAGVVLVLLAGLGVTGVRYLTRERCSGSVTAQVIASAETAGILTELSRRWARTTPSVNGVCSNVVIRSRDAAVMAQALGTDWDSKAGGPAPDVWVPDSTAWVRRASTAAVAERMMPDRQPSLARSPAVIAMPKPMAEAIGWPGTGISWQDIVTKVAADPAGWGKYGKDDWGRFRFGMTDPLSSTAGLLSLMAVLDGDDDGEVTPEEQNAVFKLKQERALYTETTGEITAGLAKADRESADAAMKYVSAFPAFEQDVVAYNKNNPKVPLVAVYPSNGSADADYPYLVLEAPWATRQKQDVARAFLGYARGVEGRKAFLDAGFRDSNREAGRPLEESPSFSAKLKTLPRAVLLPESVKQSMDTWTALTRPTNVLLVLDVSGSMNEQVPGTGRTRLQLAKDAAHGAVSLFADDVDAGLWTFSSRQTASTDYRMVVPIGQVSDQVGGKTRRDQMTTQIDKLAALGDTGLYDTAAAAQQAVADTYQKGATNLVVLITDGKNDDPTGGLSLDQLRAKLDANATSGKKVPIVTVGYGNDADFAALQEISRVSGGTLYTSKTAFDINQVLLTAIFGRI